MTNTPTAALTYYVTRERDSYGNDVTVEQAQTIANTIADRMAAYAAQQGYAAEIEIVSHRGGAAGRAYNEAGDAALDDMAAYDEAHWTDWTDAALRD